MYLYKFSYKHKRPFPDFPEKKNPQGLGQLKKLKNIKFVWGTVKLDEF